MTKLEKIALCAVVLFTDMAVASAITRDSMAIWLSFASGVAMALFVIFGKD